VREALKGTAAGYASPLTCATVRIGISVPTFGDYADVRLLTDLAAEAEAAGWDGFFVWDHLVWPWADDIVDPWITLTAVALCTTRIRFGPLVTPLARRRPTKLARETVTLDRLSGGRLILGVGLGEFTAEFADLGEPADPRIRAAMLDEALSVLSRLWSGDQVDFAGVHYRIRHARFRPTPVQHPRVPVWVGGTWPRRGPLARAAQWDGYVPMKREPAAITPAEVAAMADRLDLSHRPGFDLVISGAHTDPAPYRDAGATWWVESLVPWQHPLAEVRQRIRTGPPH
jgi:alkanesulfonate monooxygenase SsuD/methylene tetrahydromethanopterin reductase-like flavin-dependent oxidoreductase (luciferase family)